MESTIDATDLRIIQLLQANAKATIKEIATSLNITNTPVYDRIKKLEKGGYIKYYTAVVDRKKMGFTIVAFCSVTLETHNVDVIRQFESDIKELQEVQECYHIAGMFDYLLKVNSRDMEDYQQFIIKKLAAISNIGKVQSSFVMTAIKDDY